MAAVAERLVAGLTAPAERGPRDLLDGAVGPHHGDRTANEERTVRVRRDLDRRRRRPRLPAKAADPQGPGGAALDCSLDLISRRLRRVDPGPPILVEDERQGSDAVLRVVTETRSPLDDELIGGVLANRHTPTVAQGPHAAAPAACGGLGLHLHVAVDVPRSEPRQVRAVAERFVRGLVSEADQARAVRRSVRAFAAVEHLEPGEAAR